MEVDSDIGIYGTSGALIDHSPLMPASLMIGHHLSISAFCKAASASGVCWFRGKTSSEKSETRARIVGCARASITAALSFVMIGLGVPFAAQSPRQLDTTKPGSPASSAVGIFGAAANLDLVLTA